MFNAVNVAFHSKYEQLIIYVVIIVVLSYFSYIYFIPP